MKRKRWLVIAPWVIAFAWALLFTSIAAGHPKTTYVYNHRGNYVPLLDCGKSLKPDQYCILKYRMANDDTVSMICWVDNTWYIGDYNSNRWFKITWKGHVGWTHSSWVYNQTKTPNCKDVKTSTADTGVDASSPNASSGYRTVQSHSKVLHPKTTYVWNDMLLMGVDFWNCAPFDPTPTPCKIVANVKNDTTVTMVCWADFPPEWKGGNYPSARWFRIKYGSKKYWVHSSFVYRQTKVGHC